MKKQISSASHELKDDIYLSGKISPLKLTIIGVLIFFFGFLINFPIKERLSGILTSTLTQNRNCPIYFDKLKLGFFFPKIKLLNPSISARCFGNSNGENLNLEKFTVSLGLPAIAPPGIKINAYALEGKSKLKVITAISFGSQKIKIPKSTIEAKLLSKIMGNKLAMKGNIQIESLIQMSDGKPQNGSIKIKSTDLRLPTQNIQNFNLPNLNLGHFLLKGNLTKTGKFLVKDFILGNDKSPIIANITGSIQINQSYINGSTLDLKGKVKFSQSFQKDFPILNLLIGGKKTDKNGFLNFTIKGPMGKPKHRFL